MRTIQPVRTALLASVAALGMLPLASASAQRNDTERFVDAAKVLELFTTDEQHGIPADILQRARGIAVIPNLIRGGFVFGGRRGRGVLAIRSPNGEWSNPAFVTLTGGSFGAQFGAESADVVLVFANDRSVRNIASGKFTLGGHGSCRGLRVHAFARTVRRRGVRGHAARRGRRCERGVLSQHAGLAARRSDARDTGCGAALLGCAAHGRRFAGHAVSGDAERQQPCAER